MPVINSGRPFNLFFSFLFFLPLPLKHTDYKTLSVVVTSVLPVGTRREVEAGNVAQGVLTTVKRSIFFFFKSTMVYLRGIR